MNRLILCCIFILFSCSKKKNEIKLPDIIKKVSILEFCGWLPYYEIENDSLILDDNYNSVIGIVEISKYFKLNIVKKPDTIAIFKYGEKYAADWMRQATIETINRFSTDSIYYDEERIRIYDGHYCFLLIEKTNGQKILLSGIPDPISKELRELSYFMRDSADIYLNKKIENQDSIRNYMKELGKYRLSHIAMPPMPDLPIKEIRKLRPY